MGRAQAEFSHADIGVARYIQPAAGAGVNRTVVTEHQNEVNGRGIGWGWNDRNGNGTVLVAAADADQEKSQNAQQAGPTPTNHPHPSRTIHELTMTRKRFHFNGWLEYAPAESTQLLAFGS